MFFLVNGRFKKNFRSWKSFGGATHPGREGNPQLPVAVGEGSKKERFLIGPIRQSEGSPGESATRIHRAT